MHVGACSDAGRVRTGNEDAYGWFASPNDDEQLFMVADGMGGYSRGAEASRTAIRVVQRTFFEEEDASVEGRLVRAFKSAGAQVYQLASDGRSEQKMGTTCTTLFVAADKVVAAHVGDSRLYRFNHSSIDQLTRDHTAVADLQRRGVLTKAEARSHPRRHVLSRALGTQPDLEVDILHLDPPQPGDGFLLCTDGLLSLGDTELQRTARDHPPQQACELLVQQANDRGGHDNITALIVTVS